jgi:AGZA family xanthine/uracil permease-like MFS transporter
MIGGGWMTEGGSVNPVTAPALVIVGAMMVRNVVKIDWQDATEGIPAFLVLIGIPLSYSIADGLALGCIAYPVLKLAAGRGREANGLIWVVAVHFVLRYLFIHA